MKPIGGYFELELNQGQEYHTKALRLNLGRSAFEYILRARKAKLVYLPYFTCDTMLLPIKRLGLKHEFYHINEKLEPIFDYGMLNDNSYFVFTNYFGLKDGYIGLLSKLCPNLIIDNSQAFFSKPMEDIDTFYSVRKYFGVPDGAYLYSNALLKGEFFQDNSANRFRHLIGRIENGVEESFKYFKKNEKLLNNQPIKSMSKITRQILLNIDYQNVEKIRIYNYCYLQEALGGINLLSLKLEKGSVPLVYPFLPKKNGLREKLIKNKIFVAQYWYNVLEWCTKTDLEYMLAQKIVHLPIDQRINANDIDYLLKVITR